MSCLNLGIPKKLKQLPSTSKKAWKSFTSSLHPKLHHLSNHLKIPSSVTRTAHRLLHLSPKHHRSHMGGFSYNRTHHQYQYRHLQQSASVPASPATIYVDRLYGESSRARTITPASTSTHDHDVSKENHESCGKQKGAEQRRKRDALVSEENHEGHVKEKGAEQRRKRERVGSNMEDQNNLRWKEYVSSLPVIRGVDERAEEFISKFRQEMQLQREQSIVEFQQMLARSA